MRLKALQETAQVFPGGLLDPDTDTSFCLLCRGTPWRAMLASLASPQMGGTWSQVMGRARCGSGIGNLARRIATSRHTRRSALTPSGTLWTAAGWPRLDGMA